jgi:hypothetical protein
MAKELSERQVLNRIAKTITEMQPAFTIEVLSRGPGSFQNIIYGPTCNIVFVGDYKDLEAYLRGVRDVLFATKEV